MTDFTKVNEPISVNNINNEPNCNEIQQKDAKTLPVTSNSTDNNSVGETGNYWKLRYEKLFADYTHLQKLNERLEDKLLNIVDSFEKKREELVANVEYEKSTLMADVNKLSTKLVDARIKLHDYEEKELIHASECDAPCHRSCTEATPFKLNGNKDQISMHNDPNLV